MTPIGVTLTYRAHYWGATTAIPFSAMHRFQRTDSAWAEPHASQVEDYPEGFDSSRCELLPAYVRYECMKDEVTPLNPAMMSSLPSPSRSPVVTPFHHPV